MPLEIVKNAIRYITHKNIIDLGIGAGRNAHYLIDNGFFVKGVDNDTAFLKDTIHPNIAFIHDDATHFLCAVKEVENILTTFCLRFTGKMFKENIRTMQEKTKRGGIHIIVDFIDDGGDFVKAGKYKDFYWLKEGELQSLYTNYNWDILFYSEENSKTRLIDISGNYLYCRTASIIARRK